MLKSIEARIDNGRVEFLEPLPPRLAGRVIRRSADENLPVATLARAWIERVHRLATVATAGRFSSAVRLITFLDPEAAGSLADATSPAAVNTVSPDQHFTAEQQQRLQELMERWRTVRYSGNSLEPDEQAELEQLVDAEVGATERRTAEVALRLGR